jgi:hypothetical protein
MDCLTANLTAKPVDDPGLMWTKRGPATQTTRRPGHPRTALDKAPRTHNPSVAGSSPARPTKDFAGHRHTFPAPGRCSASSIV